MGDFHRPHIIMIITYTTEFVKYERIIKMKNYIIKDAGTCFDVYELLLNGIEKLVFIGFSKDDYTIDLVKNGFVPDIAVNIKYVPNKFCRNKIPMPVQKCAGKILDSWRQMRYNKGCE